MPTLRDIFPLSALVPMKNRDLPPPSVPKFRNSLKPIDFFLSLGIKQLEEDLVMKNDFQRKRKDFLYKRNYMLYFQKMF